jgi:hypothetical protein
MQYLIGTSVYGASGAGYKKAAVNGIASFDVGAFSASAGTAVRFMPVGWNRSFSMRDTAPAITARVGPPARVKMLSQFTRVSQGGYYLTTAVQDAAGNVVDTATRTITVSIINAAALTGTTTATAVAGFAAHNNTVLLGPAIGARFVTTSPGLLPDTSAPFTIVGNVYKAKIVSMPATAVKGGVMGAVKVIPLDSLGNYPSFGGTGIGLSTTLGTLNGTLTRTATYAGTDTFPSAVFSDLSLSTAGTARLVTRFTNVGYAGVPDSGSALLVAPYSGPAVLQFVQQPSSIVAGSTMSTTPTVAIRDSVGNLVTDSVARPVLLSLGTNPGAATLTGTLSASATPGTGIVSFPNISVNNVGNGYTLIATTTVPGVQGAASASFNALTTTDALALRFINTSVTSLDTAGTALGAAGGIQVEVINSAGSRVTTSTAPISLAVTNPRGGVLTGTVSVNAVAGLATFSSAVLTRADTGYSIVATSPSLNSSTAPVRLTVLPAAAAKLVVLDSLPLTVAGATWPAMRVAITDAFANVVTTAANSVTLRVGTGNYPGDSSFTYYSGRIGGVGAAAPVLTVAATNGIATFTGLRPRNLSTASSTSGFNFIFFDATGLTAGRSPKFDVVGSTATSAVSYVYSNTGSYLNNIGAINNQGIQVAGFFLDSLRNNTTGSGNVTLQLAKFRGGSITSGATLVGNATGTALNGNFSIQGLKVSGLTVTDTLFFRAVVTGGSTVTFDSSYYGGIQYSPFGAATQLVFVNPPANTTVNTAIASPTGIKVAVADSIGNTVTNLNTGVGGLTGQISLELSTIPTGVTAVLSGSGPVNIVNGVATFASTAVNAVGTGYAMRARVQGGTSIPGVTAAIISALFNITP